MNEIKITNYSCYDNYTIKDKGTNHSVIAVTCTTDFGIVSRNTA